MAPLREPPARAGGGDPEELPRLVEALEELDELVMPEGSASPEGRRSAGRVLQVAGGRGSEPIEAGLEYVEGDVPLRP